MSITPDVNLGDIRRSPGIQTVVETGIRIPIPSGWHVIPNTEELTESLATSGYREISPQNDQYADFALWMAKKRDEGVITLCAFGQATCGEWHDNASIVVRTVESAENVQLNEDCGVITSANLIRIDGFGPTWALQREYAAGALDIVAIDFYLPTDEAGDGTVILWTASAEKRNSASAPALASWALDVFGIPAEVASSEQY